MNKNISISHAQITRLSPAKINLFLHIIGKRADGYHNLQTVFRLLDWGDYLHFLPAEYLDLSDLLKLSSSVDQQTTKLLNEISNEISNELCAQLVILTGAETITDSLADNLIIKAAHALLAYAIALGKLPAQLQRVSITLDKHLPMGAGLGGGSSNAATTLLVLNELWQLNFNNKQLRAVGVTIGADVPIFIFGQDAIAMGIGEQLIPITLPDQQYLVLTPDAHVNTAKLFAHPKLQRDIAPLSIETIKNHSNDYVQHLNTPYQNVFTPVVTSLAPAVDEVLHYLQSLEQQALGTARMTGSGSAVFLPLDSSVATDKALLAKWIEEAPCAGYVVESL